MFHFFMGIVSVIAVSTFVRNRPRGGFGLHRAFGRHHRCVAGWIHRRMLNHLFDHLRTSPSQEEEIRSAVEAFKSTVWEVKDSAAGIGREVSERFRKENLDTDELNELLNEKKGNVDKIHQALVTAISRVHAVLTQEQRQRLAEHIESHHRCGGHHCCGGDR